MSDSSKEHPAFACEGCKWHETEYTPATIYNDEEYDSYCSAGMDDYILEAYELNPYIEPCPLRVALEDRDEWKAKAMEYREKALDAKCREIEAFGGCPITSCVDSSGHVPYCTDVLKAVDGE